MKRGRKISYQEKLKKAAGVCDLYATDDYTLEDCCRNQGISPATFYNWVDQYGEIRGRYKKAQAKAESAYFTRLKIKSRKSLEKRVSGYEVEEKKVEYKNVDGKLKVVSQVVTKKFVQPSDTAIIFSLTNKDPENFKHKQHIEHSPAGGKYDFSHLTDEQLEKLEAQLEKAYERKGSRAVDS